MRELDTNIYGQWATKFKDASTSLEERENKLKAVAEEIEKDLLLIGITAIEDKLQEVGEGRFKLLGIILNLK
jgi:magnesium-transporting ATPase (P-type)